MRMTTAPIKTTARTYCEKGPNGLREEAAQDGRGETVYEVYNTKYIIGDDGTYHDVMIMLAGGGPTIWLDTWAAEIRGSWGSDKYTKYIYDYEYINDYFEEQYGCLS